MYILSTHCPLIKEIHIQGCPELTAPAVVNLIRTLAYRNGLLRKPSVLSIEMAKCSFLTPAVVEEIEKQLYSAHHDASATGRRRRANEVEIELSRRTDERTGAPSGAPAPTQHASYAKRRAHEVAQAQQQADER
jgi:hypothetical protein